MHTEIIAGWNAPSAPGGYPDLTAIKFVAEFGQNYQWHMDFSRADSQGGRLFASDAEKCPAITWPWREGMNPSEEDWAAIGFAVITITNLSNDIRVAEVTPTEIANVIREIVREIGVSLIDAAATSGYRSATKH